MNGKPCKVEGCERDAAARGMCRNHYNKWLRNPDRDLNTDLRHERPRQPTPAEKACKMCGEVKPAEDYYKNRNGNLHSYCKPCHNLRTMADDQKRRAEARANKAPANHTLDCVFEGCHNKRRSGVYCWPHRLQQLNGGPVVPLRTFTHSKVDDNHRLCTACEQVLPNDDFYKKTTGAYASTCKPCASKVSRFATLMRQDRLEEAIRLAESMPEGIRQKYLDKVLQTIK